MTRELQDQARGHMSRNEWELAIPFWEQARQMESENTYILGQLAFCHSRLRQHSQAIELYEQLCQLEPQVARWSYSLGYQYYDQQQYAQAVEHFDRALEVEPNYIVVLYRKGYALSTMENKRGQALTTFENCRKAYHALTDEDTKNRERKHYADACYQQGKLFMEVGNQRLAEERLREAIELKPKEADVHYALGKLYVQLEKFESAITCLERAKQLAQKPEHYILDYLGRAYAGSGQLDKARQIYEQIPPRIRSSWAYILRNMADVYMKLEQWNKAEQILREAVKNDRCNHNGHYNLGLIYQQQGRWAEAAQEFKKAIELRQQNYNVPFPEAQQALESLLTTHPEAAIAPTAKPSQSIKLPTSSSGRSVGRVKKFIENKGFGFLEVEGSDDLFFHITEVEERDSVQVGEYLEYSLGERKGKPQAIKLRVFTK